MTFDDIVARYQSGKIGRDEFFSGLFDAYYPTLVAYGRQLGLSDEESRDLAQDSFVRIYRYVDQLDAQSSLRAYLLTSFRHLALNYARANRTAKRDATMVAEEELLQLRTDEPAVDDLLIAKAQLAELREAMVSALTPDETALLMSRYVEERTYTDIAETMGVSATLLRFRMQRALVKLQRYLKSRETSGGPTDATR
jgi:RNA polymerase sigma-70 factor (ECF subfamily)